MINMRYSPCQALFSPPCRIIRYNLYFPNYDEITFDVNNILVWTRFNSFYTSVFRMELNISASESLTPSVLLSQVWSGWVWLHSIWGLPGEDWSVWIHARGPGWYEHDDYRRQSAVLGGSQRGPAGETRADNADTGQPSRVYDGGWSYTSTQVRAYIV